MSHAHLDRAPRERRYKILWIPCRDLIDLWRRSFSEFLSLPVLDGVPQDCEVICVHESWERRVIGFMLYHPSFEVVPEGLEVPVIGPLQYKMVRFQRMGILADVPLYARAD